ncbi:MAG: putative glycoside hydrolase [Candidatus Taylorbacteria bacterium]|nr:putative glycoside hydrolase [Candidatus Taylorbacteria bacterium]
MRIDKNYILWALISVPILVGVFLIIRQFIFFGVIPEKGVSPEKGVRPLFLQEKGSDPFLKNPPDIIKAVYFTSTTGGNKKSIDHLIELANKSELNAVIIDIKDFSGYVAYNSGIPDVQKYKAEKFYIKDIDGLIKKLHDNNIYVIARITVFQDPVLARARPDWAVKNKYTGGPWADNKGLSWIDPACRECWGYYAAIAKDAIGRGFDEINFDYIRFPSDGNMEALVFSYWDRLTPRPKILNEFYKYMRGELGDAKMSADLFGFVTTRTEDFGVGQVMEDAFEYFDFISPMVYPSHYPNTFLGFANPAAHPYEVIYHTMKSARERLEKFYQATGNTRAKIRPWLQDFDLGADYTEAMVRAEIKATQDALGEHYKGFMIWNARNVYHEGVF